MLFDTDARAALYAILRPYARGARQQVHSSPPSPQGAIEGVRDACGVYPSHRIEKVGFKHEYPAR